MERRGRWLQCNTKLCSEIKNFNTATEHSPSVEPPAVLSQDSCSVTENPLAAWTQELTIRVTILTLPPASWVTLGNLLRLQCLNFLICKMEIISLLLGNGYWSNQLIYMKSLEQTWFMVKYSVDLSLPCSQRLRNFRLTLSPSAAPPLQRPARFRLKLRVYLWDR